MERIQKQITVVQEDLDDLNHVNNVRYLEWIQDIAKEHWQNYAPKAIQRENIWVVKKHIIDYKSSAVLGDAINIATYIAKSEGAISTRIVEMKNVKTDKLIVHSETQWCLLNPDTFRPKRISEVVKNVFIEKH